jgi:selenocysteine-specific elongation factor
MHGFGTVVAGTVLGGAVRAGDRVAIYPEGLVTRVRGVQVHGSKAEASGVGRRTALNLPDAAKEDLRRGQVAAAEGSLAPTSRLDARLDVLPDAARGLKHRERVRLHIGTDEVMARLAVIGAQTVEPGAAAPVQLILERPTVALPGDRFVIRLFSPVVTVGGGQVLDASPARHKRFSGEVLEGLEKLGGSTRDAVEQLFAQAGGIPQTVGEIALKAGRSDAEVADAVAVLLAEGRLVAVAPEGPPRYLHAGIRDRLADGLAASVRAYFKANPFRETMPFSDLRAEFLAQSDAATLKHLLDELVGRKVFFRRESGLGLVGRETQKDPVEEELRRRVEGVFQSARFAAPLEDDVRLNLGLNPSVFNPVLNGLVRSGTLVRLAPKVTYHRETIEAARAAVAGLIERHGSVSIAELRDRLDLSRKYAQAILEYFDRTGFTRRVGDRHVPAKS